ncbi:hypothetical protein [Marilutibacter chinensis]|uniref:ATP-grasp domain-containing protein n=1 Tax=Marilutibacter chinensis TaxID=2912247 RepID=A0ABS9HQH0_9GAMM|nr:hypothetical protein [Lysobacter chinensis]MCF7221189.1 hypothetical protein [Lysobacter chinensis]MCF7223070.1 hypothetical protein [Lysobacter chinensis]
MGDIGPQERAAAAAERTRAGTGDAAPPAIVVARGFTGLGTLRALAMAGVRTHVACPADDLVTRSRWYAPPPGPAWNGEIDGSQDSALDAVGLARAVLVPGADDAALWVAGLAGSALARRFPASTSPLATLRMLQDKRRLAECLRDNGVAHPATFAIDRVGDIDRIPFERLDRVFLKPIDSQRFSKATGHKALWPGDRAACRALWTRLHAQGFEMIAQEYIPGGADQHYFIDGFRDRHGRLTGLFARRRYRIHPPDFGNSSYCESTPLAGMGAAAEELERLLDATHYRGIFSAEFKRDPRDGRYRLLEINTRAWWYVEFAARCGVNVCEMAWRDALGLPVVVAGRDYRSGVGCISLAGDIQAVLHAPAGTRIPLSRALRQWCTGHLHAFRFDDPGPGLLQARRLAAQWWRARRQRLSGLRGSPDERAQKSPASAGPPDSGNPPPHIST